jgi:ribosomal protein S18 acetylase RimI-like enzyme
VELNKMDEIQILDFDTELFGFKVGRFTAKNVSLQQAAEIVEYCRKGAIKCLYAELDSDNFASLNAASGSGFVISGIKVMFEKDLSNFVATAKNVVEGYQIDNNISDSDVEYLKSLSRQMSRVSRFSFDKNFPAGAAEDLYVKWILNSINKKVADEVFISRCVNSGEPVGIITCKKDYDGDGRIMLVGVDKSHRGRGIGGLLVSRALEYFKDNGFDKTYVGTQGSNIPAQRLYGRMGFLTRSLLVVFHLWTD